MGTSSFDGRLPEDRLLEAEVVHDASTGYVRFKISDKATGEIYAEAFTVHDAFKHDGQVGFGMNNDAGGWDNFVVRTRDSLPLDTKQTLTIDGDLDLQPGGTLEIDVLSAAAHDQLEVSGAASIAGVLELTAVDIEQLAYGATVEILTASGVAGIFSNVEGVLHDDKALAVIYDSDTITIQIALPGDANLDGVVDGQDFIAWNDSKFLPGTSWVTGDFNGDGITDGQDFVIWNNFKFSSLPSAVPEPDGVISLLLVGLLVVRYRWLAQF